MRDLSRLRARKSTPSTSRVQRGARVHRRETARVRCRCGCAMRRRKLMKGLGYGKGYRYAHDEEDAYAAGEHYLPDDMPATTFYTPTERGLEARIRESCERCAVCAIASAADPRLRKAQLSIRA